MKILKIIYRNALLIVVFLFSAGNVNAQEELSIVGDTIRMSSDAYAVITFMSEPTYHKLGGSYLVQKDGQQLTITPNKNGDKPKGAILMVTEGPRNNPRQHRFVIVYDKRIISADEVNYDFSSEALIKKEIQRMNSVKKRKSDPQVHSAIGPPDDPDKNESSADESGAAGQRGGAEEAKLLGSIDSGRINDRIKLKLSRFNEWCSYLCDKQYPNNKNALIDRMMTALFEDKNDVIVETVNVRTNETKSWKIREYFTRLTKYNYSRVRIKTSAIKFITKLKPSGPGEFEATLVVIQDFDAYRDINILAYKDKTQKAITVKVKVFDATDAKGNPIKDFEIYFGNIKVDNTQ